MENKKLQQPLPEALKDEQLDQVTGGVTLNDWIETTVQRSSFSEGEENLKKMAEERKQTVFDALENASRIGEPALSKPAIQPIELPEDMLWNKPAPTI